MAHRRNRAVSNKTTRTLAESSPRAGAEGENIQAEKDAGCDSQQIDHRAVRVRGSTCKQSANDLQGYGQDGQSESERKASSPLPREQAESSNGCIGEKMSPATVQIGVERRAVQTGVGQQ